MFVDHGENRSAELLEWQYLRHLTGAEVCIAHTSAGLFEGPAALYAAFPTMLSVGGQKMVGFQSFDTLTCKPFRGRGLFVTLAELLYERLRNQGVSLVYGIPNGDSIGGFIRRLGWTSLASWGDELLDSAISLMKHANADVILAWALELNSTHIVAPSRIPKCSEPIVSH